MNYSDRIAQLYKITCLINEWVYWGMTYTKNKNYLDRFEEHKIGKGGIHLYKGMCEYGVENFTIELVDIGSFEDISDREKKETKNTLYKQNMGWNGNTGNAIFNTPEKIKMIVSKRKKNENVRVEKFKESYKKLDQKIIQNKRKNTIKNKSEEEIKSWRTSITKNVKGQNKNTNDRIKRQSETLKEKWKNPTESMLTGVKKCAEWRRGKNKHNCIIMMEHSERMKGKYKGINNPMFKHYYITPLGKFESYLEANITHNSSSKHTIQKLCKNPNKVITKTIARGANLDSTYIDKTSKDVGFGLEYV